MSKLRKVAILDYGVGNIASIANALSYIGGKSILTAKESEIKKCDAIILPGVGAFGEAARKIRENDIDKMLQHYVFEQSFPILGVCLGMQLLASTSEEKGNFEGLNWIPDAKVLKIPLIDSIRVPHVGWKEVSYNSKSKMFERISKNAEFYFDHSYYFSCEKKYVTSFCDYGIELTASVQKDNIWGVQFHPEKSQISGLRVLKSFLLS